MTAPRRRKPSYYSPNKGDKLAASIVLLGFVFFVVALALSAIVNVARAADLSVRVAPVVRPSQIDGVMFQTGWQSYTEADNVVLLYCVEQTDRKLTCVVYTELSEGKWAVVLVPNLVSVKPGA